MLSLELVSKPSEADGDAGEVDEGLVDAAVVFVPDDEAAELLEPGDGAFDFPAAAVTTKLAAVLGLWTNATAPVGTDQVPAFGQQSLS